MDNTFLLLYSPKALKSSMNFKISEMVRLTTPVVLTQMNAAALIYDLWLRLLRVEVFAGRA